MNTATLSQAPTGVEPAFGRFLSDASECTVPEAVGASASGTNPLVRVLAARCGTCNVPAKVGFKAPREFGDWAYLLPFVCRVDFVRANDTLCKHCGAVGAMLFATEPYVERYATELAS